MKILPGSALIGRPLRTRIALNRTAGVFRMPSNDSRGLLRRSPHLHGLISLEEHRLCNNNRRYTFPFHSRSLILYLSTPMPTRHPVQNPHAYFPIRRSPAKKLKMRTLRATVEFMQDHVALSTISATKSRMIGFLKSAVFKMTGHTAALVIFVTRPRRRLHRTT